MKITEKEKKQKEKIFLRFVYDFIQKKHMSPTLRELGIRTGLTLGPVQAYRDSLIDQGLLGMVTKSPRSMYLTEAGLDALGVK